MRDAENMKSSARNQWSGKVIRVHLGAVTAEVIVMLQGSTEIVATMTVDSAKRLGLENGKEVIALVNASMVIIALDFEGYALSARNQLSGEISSVHTGLVTADITIRLSQGKTVTAAVTTESCQTLGLKVGMPAIALFKAGSVVLATRR